MFKSGDKILCVNAENVYPEIKLGEIYTFVRYLDKVEFLVINEFDWPVLSYRFVKASKITARFYGHKI
jgi:hypothetical protein